MVKSIGVIGAGNMGTGIAQLVAQSGFEVVLCDLAGDIVKKSIAGMTAVFDRAVAKGKMTEADKGLFLGRIRTTTDLGEVRNVDLIIEAIVEKLDEKLKLFSTLDTICAPQTIFGSNTSTMSITKLASATKRADRFAGVHFFNPAPVMKLVEVVRGYYTSDETVATLMQVAKSMDKDPIEVKKDSPGFVVNRLMIPQMREAFILVEEGVASIEDVDKAMRLGLNHPMGPFTLMDFGGNDICYDAMVYMYSQFNQPHWAPPVSLKRLIDAGRLGKKVGKGWYDYPSAEGQKACSACCAGKKEGEKTC